MKIWSIYWEIMLESEVLMRFCCFIWNGPLGEWLKGRFSPISGIPYFNVGFQEYPMVTGHKRVNYNITFTRKRSYRPTHINHNSSLLGNPSKYLRYHYTNFCWVPKLYSKISDYQKINLKLVCIQLAVQNFEGKNYTTHQSKCNKHTTLKTLISGSVITSTDYWYGIYLLHIWIFNWKFFNDRIFWGACMIKREFWCQHISRKQKSSSFPNLM